MLLLLLLLIGLIIVFGKTHDEDTPSPSTTTNPQDLASRAAIARQVEHAANNEKEPKVKQGLLKALTIVRGTPASPPVSSATAVTKPVLQSTTLAPADTFVLKQPQSNAVTLLYVGAFLFITAMVIFSSASALGGGTRTFLVALTALVFYGAGLWLHQSSKTLKPVGQTFVAIGMIILPLVGVVAYNLVFAKQHAFGVWLVTSIVSCVAYLNALSQLRTPLMGYLSVLSAISLVEAATLTAGLPLYFVSWTLALVSMGLAMLSQFKHLWAEQKEPLSTSAHILLPTALAAAAASIHSYGWWQFAAALVLGAGFYANSALEKDRSHEERASFVTMSLLLMVATVPSIAAAWQASLPACIIALLTATTVICVSSVLLPQLGRHPLYKPALATLGLIPFMAIFGLLQSHAIVVGLVLWLIIAGSLAFVHRSANWLLTSFLPLLALPIAVSSIRQVALGSLTMAIIYSLMGIAALLARYSASHRYHEVRLSLSSLYLVALSIGWLYATAHGVTNGSVFLTIDMCLLAVASYIEQEPALYGVGYAGLYVAACMALVHSGSYHGLYVAIAFSLLSLIAYAVAEVNDEAPRAKVIQQLAPVGMFAGAFSAFFTGISGSSLPAIMLGLAGLMTGYQSHKIRSVEAEAVGYLAVTGSVSWLLANAGVHEVLVYAHLWAAMFTLMYLWRMGAKDQPRADSFLTMALLSLTVPLGVQVLGSAGSARGWFFVIEQLLVMMVGSALENKYIIRWGIIAAVSAVIYQLRDLTFLLLGALGLGIIGIAIWLLMREDKKSV